MSNLKKLPGNKFPQILEKHDPARMAPTLCNNWKKSIQKQPQLLARTRAVTPWFNGYSSFNHRPDNARNGSWQISLKLQAMREGDVHSLLEAGFCLISDYTETYWPTMNVKRLGGSLSRNEHRHYPSCQCQPYRHVYILTNANSLIVCPATTSVIMS